MAHIHLVIGPVGAGKSTLVGQLAKERQAAPLVLDDWMSKFYGGDRRPAGRVLEWYIERRDRCLAVMWEVACQFLDLGQQVVLEPGLIRAEDRAAFYEKADRRDEPLTVYWVDAPREVRRARVQRRNAERGETFSMLVPQDVFEMASDMWQAPDADECQQREMQILPLARE